MNTPSDTPDSPPGNAYLCISQEAYEDLLEVRDCLAILAGVTVDGKRHQPMLTVPRFALANVFRRFAADLDDVLQACLTAEQAARRHRTGLH